MLQAPIADTALRAHGVPAMGLVACKNATDPMLWAPWIEGKVPLGNHSTRHVLLLHANAVAADGLDALLARLEADGARFVPLPRALADDVYARPDRWAGRVGVSWLYRIQPDALERWSWDSAEEAALADRFPGPR